MYNLCFSFLVTSCPFRVSQNSGTGHANPTFKLQTPQGRRKVRALHHELATLTFSLRTLLDFPLSTFVGPLGLVINDTFLA